MFCTADSTHRKLWFRQSFLGSMQLSFYFYWFARLLKEPATTPLSSLPWSGRIDGLCASTTFCKDGERGRPPATAEDGCQTMGMSGLRCSRNSASKSLVCVHVCVFEGTQMQKTCVKQLCKKRERECVIKDVHKQAGTQHTHSQAK